MYIKSVGCPRYTGSIQENITYKIYNSDVDDNDINHVKTV